MLFNDLHFIYFFLPVLLLFYLLNKSERVWMKNIFLLIASSVFYGLFEPRFLLVLFYITFVNFLCIKLLNKRKEKKAIVTTGIILSLLPLAFYKYTYFVINDVLGIEGHILGEIALPVGISFFTFQALSYTIDIYRKKETTVPTLLEFSLYTAFFPTILSGPIERARTLMPQIRQLQHWNSSGVLNGFQLFVWGLFQKIVVADRIADYVNAVYNHPNFYGTTTIMFAIALYSIQIYCDFAGYSNMAIGVGRMLGFNIRKNFDFPYFSTSIRSFWKRWHISLTSWLTEYVYISLGGNRVKEWRWILNILIVFLVSGLWHGAAWTFIIWGLLHGIYQILEHYTIERKDYGNFLIKLALGIVLFSVVSLAWVFFRAHSLNHALTIIGALGNGGIPFYTRFATEFALMVILLIIFIVSETFMFLEWIKITDNKDSAFSYKNLGFMCALILFVSLFGLSGSSFVYFQF